MTVPKTWRPGEGVPCSSVHGRTIEKRIEFILSEVEYFAGGLVLDVGTGHGVYVSRLSAVDIECVGIDISRLNLRNAGKMPESSFALMNGEHLGFKDRCFDCALLIELIEHVSDDSQVIREVHRVLKPGGLLVLTAPNRLCPFDTHGALVGTRSCSTKGLGIPLLPYLPIRIRQKWARARVYTPRNVEHLLGDGFVIRRVGFLAPGLDQVEFNFPGIGRSMAWVQRLLSAFERAAFPGLIMPTIIVSAERC